MRKLRQSVWLALACGALVACAASAQSSAGGRAAAPAARAKEKPAAGDPAAGKKLFKKDCSICHYDTESIQKVGIGMKGLFKRPKLPVSGKPVTEAALREVIEKGLNQMPGFKYTKKEMDDLLAFLKTL